MLGRSILALAAVALPVSGCGGGSDSAHPARTAKGSTVQTGSTFRAADVGFTFQIPRGFKQVDEPNDGKALASVTPAPGDVNNGLKIRKTADQELPFLSYAGKLRAQFEQQLATKVSERTQTVGALKLGILEWRRAYTKTDLGQEKTVMLHSTSYFFAGDGKTWQLECLSSQDHRSDIDRGCRQAISSIKFPQG
ncbi:MAG TPA: hypothetical protein VIL53_07155 [Solirubrobacterales bacterium]|jgi:hypothetical protein